MISNPRDFKKAEEACAANLVARIVAFVWLINKLDTRLLVTFCKSDVLPGCPRRSWISP